MPPSQGLKLTSMIEDVRKKSAGRRRLKSAEGDHRQSSAQVVAVNGELRELARPYFFPPGPGREQGDPQPCSTISLTK